MKRPELRPVLTSGFFKVNNGKDTHQAMGTVHWAFSFSPGLGNITDCVKAAKHTFPTELPPRPVLDIDGVQQGNKAAQTQQGQMLLEMISSCELLSWIMRHGPSWMPQCLLCKYVWLKYSIGAMVLSVADNCPTAAWSTLPLPQKAFLWLWRSPSAHSFQATHLPSYLPSPIAHLLKCSHSRWLLSITAGHRRQLWWRTKTDSTRSHCSVSNRHAALFLNNSTDTIHIVCSKTPW